MSVSAGDFPTGTPNRLSLRVGCYVLFGFATSAALIRLYTRTYVARVFGWDDMLIVLAWLTEVAHVACVKLQFEHGVGWHIADLETLPDAATVMQRFILWPWVTQALYYFGLGCVKASIVALYLRLAVTPLQRQILWGVLVFILVQGLSSTIVVAAFLCSPISQVWTTPSAIGGPTCINILSFNYYNVALFIVVDIFLALSPIVVIKDMQMNARRKRSLAIMFSLGMFAIAGTIARQVTNAIAITHTADFTWHWAPTALCSILESSLGIVFVCVPAMAPLFKKWVGGSSAAKYSHTLANKNYRSNRPSTFGKLHNKPSFRPNDDSYLFNTQITAVDANDRDPSSYEMDQQTGNDIGDGGSERRIITPPLDDGGEGAYVSPKQKGGNGDGRGGKGGVRVNVEYEVSHSNRNETRE